LPLRSLRQGFPGRTTIAARSQGRARSDDGLRLLLEIIERPLASALVATLSLGACFNV
jgi:hypothetical protein